VAFQPQALGKYWLVDRIATGGMAEVFKAKTYGHGGFEHLLVIKRILSQLGEDPEFVDMFIDEAKVSVALQHANIVRLYDFGRIGDEWFMAMEFLDGKDVRNLLRKLSRGRRFLPVELAIFIAAEACKGLDYAHKKTDLEGRPYGIVHRDMSPSNLLVSYEGEVKVADFGIAKAKFSSETTLGGVLKGKYEYMSPEHALGKRMDLRADLFSLGIVLHEMLTGRRLFKTGSDVTTLEKVKAADVPIPSEVNPRVPKALDRIVLKALAREPEDRWATAAEMGQALQEYLFPQTADQLRGELARLMRDVFADEILEERDRLSQGSAIASRMREKMGEGAAGWDAQTSSSLGRSSLPHVARQWGPLALAAAALLLVPVLGLAIAGLVWVARSPGPAPVPVVVAPATGGLDVLVAPVAEVWVDGVSRGQTDVLKLDDLAPGVHGVRLVREGYVEVYDTIVVEAGKRAAYTRTLEALPAPTPEPVTTTVRRTSSTPAPTASAQPAAEAPADAPGTLTVSIVGGGWAHVWVDGVQLDGTAPLSHSLTPGPHDVRVENADLGIAHSERVVVESGGKVTVRAKPF